MYHKSVLLKESIDNLKIKKNGIYKLLKTILQNIMYIMLSMDKRRLMKKRY